MGDVGWHSRQNLFACEKPLPSFCHSSLTPTPSTYHSLSFYQPVSSVPTLFSPGEPSPSSLDRHPSTLACQCRAHSSPPKSLSRVHLSRGRERRTAFLRRSCGFNLLSPTGSPAFLAFLSLLRQFLTTVSSASFNLPLITFPSSSPAQLLNLHFQLARPRPTALSSRPSLLSYPTHHRLPRPRTSSQTALQPPPLPPRSTTTPSVHSVKSTSPRHF